MQEVIIQNFRAKPDTAMRHADDLGLEEYLAAIAVSRLVLGPKVRLQAPPNLVDLEECRALLGAGVDDWGGVSPLTPDHVNPERPWPSLERLRAITAESGFELRARLTVHPEYVVAGEPWIDPRVSAHVAALADDDGLVRDGVTPDRSAVAGARRRLRAAVGRTDLHDGRRHRGPHRRPPLRLRQRLRRLGLPACGGWRDRAARAKLPVGFETLAALAPQPPAGSRAPGRRRAATRATSPTSTR